MSEANNANIALGEGTVVARRYTIIDVLGTGGFGITYRATDADGRRVAVKEYFRSSLCSRRGCRMEYSDPVSAEVLAGMKAFVNEGKRLVSISGKHDNIVKAKEIVYYNDTVYIVMELVEGKNLDALMRSVRGGEPMGEREAVEAMMPIVEAVAMLHADRIAHLDIKPANIIMSDGGGRPVLIDFGLSKHYDKSGAATTVSTMAGCTPGYAPPEQYAGDIGEFSPQSDVYSLAATLFFLLTGQTPPTASSAGSAVIAHRLRDAGVGGALASVVARAMSTTKAERQADAAMLGRELAAAIDADGEQPAEGLKPRAGMGLRRRLTALGAAAAVVGAGALAMFMLIGADANDADAMPANSPAGVDMADTAAVAAAGGGVGYTVYGDDIYETLQAPGARLNLDIMPLDAVVGDSIIIEIGVKAHEPIADAEALGQAIRPSLKHSEYQGFSVSKRASGGDSVTIYSYVYRVGEAGVEEVPADSVSIDGLTVGWNEHRFVIHE